MKKVFKKKKFKLSFTVVVVLALALTTALVVLAKNLSTNPQIAAVTGSKGSCSGGAFCGDCINKCVSWADLAKTGGGCQAYINANCKDTSTTYGTSCTFSQSTAKANNWTIACNCYNESAYNPDIADVNPDTWFSVSGGNCDGPTGLCAVAAKGACSGSTPVTQPSTQKDTWICDSNGCRITNNYTGTCLVGKYRCAGLKTGVSCLDKIAGDTPSQSKIFSTGSAYCGMVEQIDVSCGGVYKESRTKIFPPCSPSPVPSSTPFVKPSPSNVPRPSPTPSPSPLTGLCSAVQIYDTSWKLMSTSSDYASYQSGKQLYLCATGTGSATFTKAQFTVNNVTRPEVTFQKPNTSYFCDLYTIPANTYNFVVKAQVYSPQLGWK